MDWKQVGAETSALLITMEGGEEKLQNEISYSCGLCDFYLGVCGQGQKVQKAMMQSIDLIFRYLQNRSRIQEWLTEQARMRIEDCIINFDEHRKLIVDDAKDNHSQTKSRKHLSWTMLKGDSITLI
nr:small nuclear ribonucleoprotein E-like [Rattus norvegicus]